MLFFAALFGALYKYKDEWTLLSGYYKAAWASLLSFLIVSYFYATAIPYEHFFSGIALIAFISLGILMSSEKERDKKPFVMSYVIILSGFVCLVWFANRKVSYESFKEISLDIEEGKSQEAIKKLERVYHSFYNASFDYKTSYGQLIAEQYAITGNKEKAQKYFQEALKLRPHDELLLRSYINYCINENINLKDAKKQLDLLITIQSNHTDNQSLVTRLKSLQ